MNSSRCSSNYKWRFRNSGSKQFSMITRTLASFVVFTLCIVSSETFAQTFTRIDTGAIVKDLGNSQGSCWGDYDNDGFQDLYIINSSYIGQNKPDLLYHNEGDGTFSKVTSGVTNEIIQVSGSASWGDYDNDEDLDLIVSIAEGNSRLYHNEGNGGFTKFTSGFEDIAGDVGWVDYDNDGWLDLFGWGRTKEQNLLYHNNGNGTFASIDTGEIVSYYSYAQSANWADFDNDGDMDVFISNLDFYAFDPSAEKPRNSFYINEGGGYFTPMPPTAAVLGDEENTSGASWGDYDNDGNLDLFVENFRATNILYHNNGDGTFDGFIIDPPEAIGANTIGCTWGDFDNDGDLDLFVTCDRGFPRDPPPTFKENLLFRNDGDGNFARMTTGDVVKDGGHTCSVADYDNDGDLDILVINGSLGYPYRNYLYSNDGNDNSWINITCVGTVSNRSAIGARVRAKATINGAPVWQMREIAQMTSEHSNNSLRVHFGFGDATVIDSLVIRWPSGIEDIYTTVELKKFYTATENQDLDEIETSVAENTSDVPMKFELSQNYPNPFNPETRIRYEVSKLDRVVLKVMNLLGQEVRTLVDEDKRVGFYEVVWDGRDNHGQRVVSGLYLYRLEARGFVQTRKMLLLR